MTDSDIGLPEEYRGTAILQLGDASTTLHVRLSARFEPVEGRYRWAGRAAPDETLLARFRAGIREAILRIEGGASVPVRIGEPDPWGGMRLSGVGKPPW
ncbi:MAG TPA: DUF4873 domain-containing protein [Actinoplanes sp.]|jgi:hypothetical protein|nr:DUF4873 domain-containing protein [Actinoplanes sp.]